MARKFSELREKMSPERKQKIRERTAAMLLAMDLAELRDTLDVTQEELAARLQISQSVTRMSSRGRVVIPEEVRTRMGLGTGSQFMVLGDGDVVILKAIRGDTMKDFDRLIGQAEASAKRAGVTPEGVEEAVRSARGGE